MDQSFFNRILHLVNTRPQAGRRMIGLGRIALWELWQRIRDVDGVAEAQRGKAPERKRQVGGGRRSSVSAVGDPGVSAATLDDARVRRNDWLCRINGVELHP